jgi:tRNA (cytidine/uridine-2'-O-)-methyltransferase
LTSTKQPSISKHAAYDTHMSARQRSACPAVTVSTPPAVVSRRQFDAKDKTMPNLRIALYQPDIPGNTGTILRLAACLGLSVDIIEPAGFDISDRNLKRAGMDYISSASLTRHVNWERFEEWRATTGRRLLLASTKAALPYVDIAYRPDDILLFGRESAGVPDHVHDKADERLIIPMVEGQRSINVAMSAAMISGEALRQTAWA